MYSGNKIISTLINQEHITKNLNDLQLSIPSINLLESRKIVGGYAGGDQDWPGTTVLDEVIITPDPDPIPDSGIDPHENDNDQNINQDNDQYSDQDHEYDNDQSHQNDNDREIKMEKLRSLNKDANFNLETALKHLRESAHKYSQRACGTYVKNALIAGGFNIPISLSTNSAKDFDNHILPCLGYHEVDIKDYQPQAGDIVVHEAQPNHEHGHTAMFDGDKWYSDFGQIDLFGGRAFRNNPNYSIWRR